METQTFSKEVYIFQYPGGRCITITSKPIPSIAESSKSNHTMGTANTSRVDLAFIQAMHQES